MKTKTKKITSFAMLTVFIASITSGCVTSANNNAALNEQFSSKLAEQYGATSERSFTDMIGVIYDKGEVSTTFTRDGVETDVFIKQVHNGSRDKIELLFTVYDEGSLYPEAK